MVERECHLHRETPPCETPQSHCHCALMDQTPREFCSGGDTRRLIYRPPTIDVLLSSLY